MNPQNTTLSDALEEGQHANYKYKNSNKFH